MNRPPDPALPFSPAAERNREPIAQALQAYLPPRARVLEFGAGSGQHACHIGAARPDVEWQASDRPEALPGLQARIDSAELANLPPAIVLDLLDPATQTGIQADSVQLCFAANVLHIAPIEAVAALFGIAAHALADDGTLCLYGPVMREGRHTSEGNRAFDAALRAQDSARGLRDITELDRWARATGFEAATLIALPANNHLMAYRRSAAKAPSPRKASSTAPT